jgi:hypothetical protein
LEKNINEKNREKLGKKKVILEKKRKKINKKKGES